MANQQAQFGFKHIGYLSGGGFSIATVDQSTLTTNANYPFQVVSMMQGVGNGSDPTTNYNWVVVSFQNQMFRNTTGEN